VSISAPDNDYSAIILAVAGLKRLGWEDRITCYLEPDDFPYGVGQGALGLECRADDVEAMALCRAVSDAEAAVACTAERAFLHALLVWLLSVMSKYVWTAGFYVMQGGCQVPIGVHTLLSPSGAASSTSVRRSDAAAAAVPSRATSAASGTRTLSLSGTVLSLDGTQRVAGVETAVVALPTPHSESSPACLMTPEQWNELVVAGSAVGKALAARLRHNGADTILGPITAARPLTYGAAEDRLD
jgi:porphobilinogen deaminase